MSLDKDMTSPLLYEEFHDTEEENGGENNTEPLSLSSSGFTTKFSGITNATPPEWRTGSVEDEGDDYVNTHSDLLNTRRTFSKMLLGVSIAFVVAILALVFNPNIGPGPPGEPDDFGPCIVPFRVFDTHVHAFSGIPEDPSVANEFNRVLRQFWRSSVWGGVLVQTERQVNDTRFLSKLQLSGGKLRGVVLFPKSSTIDRNEFSLYHDAGVRGVRLDLAGMTALERENMYSRLGAGEFDTLFNLIRDRRWHVIVTEVKEGWKRILPLLIRENCRIIVDHFGFPSSASDEGFLEILLQSNEYPLLWVKATPAISSMLSEPLVREVVDKVIERVPRNRIIWGSDFDPNVEGDASYDTDRRAMVNWFGDIELRYHILSINPAELYGFEDTQNWWG
eukprot:m.59175 g.59175  ORF g.59175 m.59175 type:complete len:392 (+) comp7900_c0_seq1:58-1233(+)